LVLLLLAIQLNEHGEDPFPCLAYLTR
jgi:hypothetical protein